MKKCVSLYFFKHGINGKIIYVYLNQQQVKESGNLATFSSSHRQHSLKNGTEKQELARKHSTKVNKRKQEEDALGSPSARSPLPQRRPSIGCIQHGTLDFVRRTHIQLQLETNGARIGLALRLLDRDRAKRLD